MPPPPLTYRVLVLAPSDARRRAHVPALLDIGAFPVVDTVVELGQKLSALV